MINCANFSQKVSSYFTANKEQAELKDSPVRFHGKNASAINITLKSGPLTTSPVNSPERPSSPGSPGSPVRTGTPCPTPNTSPVSPLIAKDDKSASLQPKRVSMVNWAIFVNV